MKLVCSICQRIQYALARVCVYLCANGVEIFNLNDTGIVSVHICNRYCATHYFVQHVKRFTVHFFCEKLVKTIGFCYDTSAFMGKSNFVSSFVHKTKKDGQSEPAATQTRNLGERRLLRCNGNCRLPVKKGDLWNVYQQQTSGYFSLHRNKRLQHRLYTDCLVMRRIKVYNARGCISTKISTKETAEIKKIWNYIAIFF